jgi:hypothetical protein
MLQRGGRWGHALCSGAEREVNVTKATYEAPELVEIGTFETVTQGHSTGTFLDKDFPTGTPFNQLTFS